MDVIDDNDRKMQGEKIFQFRLEAIYSYLIFSFRLTGPYELRKTSTWAEINLADPEALQLNAVRTN